jgi:hypothetical protein
MLLILFAVPSVAAPPVAVEDVSQSGRYFNTIANVNLLQDYVEICFAGGAVLTDLHVGGGASAGGNCVPGTFGYILGLIPRLADPWATARGLCIAEGMRLPEPFELQHACEDAVAFGFTSSADTVGWASNDLLYQPPSNVNVFSVGQSCSMTALGSGATQTFLCAR